MVQLKNDLLLKACRREPIPRTPVWIMRQAGRYLPEYRRVRERSDFLTMCHTPELAAEVTLQPVDILGVDAAIIFSDILVIPEAMGMELRFSEGEGPVFEKPLRHEHDIENLTTVIPEEGLDFVLQAIQIVQQQLKGSVPLIGFAGAPWTLAAYMVEGKGSKNFTQIKNMMYTRPSLLRTLLEKLSAAVSDFLSAQIEVGAQVVQIFDSWAGILSPNDFVEFSLPYLQKVVQSVRKNGAPIIVFARGAGHAFAKLAKIGTDVLGVSWTEDMEFAMRSVNGQVALQGNLDPCALFAPKERIREDVMKVLEKAERNTGHIFNLGHGILPHTPVEHARAMVDFVKEESIRFH